jgi:hypothetical protein
LRIVFPGKLGEVVDGMHPLEGVGDRRRGTLSDDGGAGTAPPDDIATHVTGRQGD